MLRAVVVCLALLAILPATPALAAGADVRWAEKQAGLREQGTTNCSPTINRWERAMGLRVPPCRPWCGAFVHQAFLRGGIRLSARLIDPDRSYEDAVAGRRHLRRIPVEDVRRGDLLFFAFRRGLRASHVALVRGRPGKDGRAPTVEGNVGHHVTLERRGIRYAVLAARVVP